jgi:hypothetical protein
LFLPFLELLQVCFGYSEHSNRICISIKEKQ